MRTLTLQETKIQVHLKKRWRGRRRWFWDDGEQGIHVLPLLWGGENAMFNLSGYCLSEGSAPVRIPENGSDWLPRTTPPQRRALIGCLGPRPQ